MIEYSLWQTSDNNTLTGSFLHGMIRARPAKHPEQYPTLTAKSTKPITRLLATRCQHTSRSLNENVGSALAINRCALCCFDCTTSACTIEMWLGLIKLWFVDLNLWFGPCANLIAYLTVIKFDTILSQFHLNIKLVDAEGGTGLTEKPIAKSPTTVSETS